MVALLETRMDRLLRAVLSADLPGSPEDHAAVACQLAGAADALDPAGNDRCLEETLTRLHLARLRGERDGRSDTRRDALAELIRRGAATAELWVWIREDALRLRRTSGGRPVRWELNGGILIPMLRDLYEMGEQQVFRRVLDLLRPLMEASDGDIELRITHVDDPTRLRWSRELRYVQEAMGLRCRMPPLILTV